MFGIMNLDTGKCWPSQGLWYRDNIEQYICRAININTIAVPKHYINTRIVKIQSEEIEIIEHKKELKENVSRLQN